MSNALKFKTIQTVHFWANSIPCLKHTFLVWWHVAMWHALQFLLLLAHIRAGSHVPMGRGASDGVLQDQSDRAVTPSQQRLRVPLAVDCVRSMERVLSSPKALITDILAAKKKISARVQDEALPASSGASSMSISHVPNLPKPPKLRVNGLSHSHIDFTSIFTPNVNADDSESLTTRTSTALFKSNTFDLTSQSYMRASAATSEHSAQNIHSIEAHSSPTREVIRSARMHTADDSLESPQISHGVILPGAVQDPYVSSRRERLYIRVSSPDSPEIRESAPFTALQRPPPMPVHFGRRRNVPQPKNNCFNHNVNANILTL